MKCGRTRTQANEQRKVQKFSDYFDITFVI